MFRHQDMRGMLRLFQKQKYLKKPIVTTDVSGAREQLKNGINGSIVEINTK